jgi:hypothetical protein
LDRVLAEDVHRGLGEVAAERPNWLAALPKFVQCELVDQADVLPQVEDVLVDFALRRRGRRRPAVFLLCAEIR